jgi:hypothetical protein
VVLLALGWSFSSIISGMKTLWNIFAVAGLGTITSTMLYFRKGVVNLTEFMEPQSGVV